MVILPLVGILLGGTIIILSALGIVGCFGLLKYKNWARLLILILSALDLLKIPLGTALAIYTIWVLVQGETAQLFTTKPVSSPQSPDRHLSGDLSHTQWRSSMRNPIRAFTSPFLFTLTLSVGALSLIGSGCGTTQVTSPLAEQLDSAGISLYTLQLRNQAFAIRSVSLVELGADSIIQLTSDPEVKKNAMIWRMYAVPQLRGILLFSDPLAAQFDAWLFCGQVREYFKVGQGKDNFGAHQGIALRTSDSLYAQAADLMRSHLSPPEFRHLDSVIARAAKDYPIQNNIYLRASAVKELSTALGKRDYSVQSAIGRMARDLEEISGMIPIYSEQLPREARWHAEYILAEHNWDGRIDSIRTRIDEISMAVNGITGHLIKGDLDINVGRVRHLEEYIKTLEGLVDQQRSVIMEQADRLMLKTITKVETYADAKVDQATAEAYKLVDYVLLRMVLLVAAALLIAVLLAFVFRQKNRRQHA